jgi:hypothetical protein
VGKNANKLGILAGVALLLFVFGCESKNRVEKETQAAKEDSVRKYSEAREKPFAKNGIDSVVGVRKVTPQTFKVDLMEGKDFEKDVKRVLDSLRKVGL